MGWELVDAYGGEVKPLTLVPGISTTRIVEALRTGEQVPSTAGVHSESESIDRGRVRIPLSLPEGSTPTAPIERKAG